MESSFVLAHPTHPNPYGASSIIIAASASSIKGPNMAILPLTPDGTSIAAYLSPFIGSSSVMLNGGESISGSITFFLISFCNARASCPFLSTKSASINELGGNIATLIKLPPWLFFNFCWSSCNVHKITEHSSGYVNKS